MSCRKINEHKKRMHILWFYISNNYKTLTYTLFCIEILQEMEVINKSTLVWLKKYNNHPLITQKRNGILITRIENLLLDD